MSVAIRPADAADHAAYVRLFGELGVPDPVPGAQRFAESVVPMMQVACEGGVVVGYVTWRSYGTLAHLVQLAVDPGMRGRRIGELLLRAASDQARAAGCTRWYLNVKRDNAPALRLYERCGLARELESWAMKIAWDKVPRCEVEEGLAAPAEDAAIAAQFALPAERLASFRARGTLQFVVVREGGTLAAFAPFDPSYPGTPTSCAIRPDLAGALLEALRRHADPRFDFVRITVEGDRPLAEAIIALGAEVTFEILRLSAPL